jgi:hypothetical protein
MTRPSHFESLKVALDDWADFDVATYCLACCLGLMGPEDGTLAEFRRAKHVFWGANPLGEVLSHFMQGLVNCGVLEFDDSGPNCRYRWNRSFHGSWET